MVLPVLKMKQDVETRWNSTLAMLQSLITNLNKPSASTSVFRCIRVGNCSTLCGAEAWVLEELGCMVNLKAQLSATVTASTKESKVVEQNADIPGSE